MAFQRTRDPQETLDQLLGFIQQEEGGANMLLKVVAGDQEGAPFNLCEFQFTNQRLPSVSFAAVTTAIDTGDQRDALRAQIEASGNKTVLFYAPVFDRGVEKMIAVCRDGPVPGQALAGGTGLQVPTSGPPPGVAVQGTKAVTSRETRGRFHGNSSRTSGFDGTDTTFVNGTVVREGKETLTAVRGGRDLGPKTVQQLRTKSNGVELVEQAAYCWMNRQLPAAILAENFQGFAPGTPFMTCKSTRFGKGDDIDEGTGSELFGVVQTNSDVVGCSLKESILVQAFGAPLGSKAGRLSAMLEIFHPSTRRFARVPLVDVGPGEKQPAVIDLTVELDKFLGTDGELSVQFRIVV